jgi:3-isopropylmalate/(R)-2-methylmalate dehydratase small subunit
MTPFRSFRSTVVLLPLDDIDTDQIIPARYLKGTDKAGLGEHLFADRRAHADFADFARRAPRSAPGVQADGQGAAHVDGPGARVLLAGANFGCGSSREHAPWALLDWGFSAIVARSFGDIFRQNATKNGLLPITLDEAAHARVVAARAADSRACLRVDLPAQRVAIAGEPGASFGFALDPFAKHCLVHGVDELGYLLGLADRITAHERRS